MEDHPDQTDPTPPGPVTWIAFAIIVALLLMVLVALSLSQGESSVPTTAARPAAPITL